MKLYQSKEAQSISTMTQKTMDLIIQIESVAFGSSPSQIIRQSTGDDRWDLILLRQYKSPQQQQINRMQKELEKAIDQNKPPYTIFALMILTNILINLDHGILPACTEPMQRIYDMDEAELGILGSIVYLGISLMGMFAGRLYQHFNSKWLTVTALVVLEISLLLFVFIQHKISAYATRFVTGICQVFLLVYYPIWIDKNGGDKKTLWLTLLQICVPLGIFMGYGMTAIIISTGHGFELSFYIQVGLVTCFIIAFIFLSNKKLDSRRKLSEELNEAMLQHYQESLEHETRRKNKEKYKFTYMFCKLVKSKMYLVGTFTMAVILYVSTGIQFWLTKYFIEVLGFEEHDVFIAYAIVSFTGPTTGCALGGYTISRIGGYDNPKTIYYVFIFSVIGIGSALFIPFVDSFYPVATLLWLVLFFGGAMMPGLTGIMMVSVSPYLRAFGNSTGQIIKNIFGYFPSPFVYGLLNTLINNRAGIKFLMFWGIWAPVLLCYGCIHKYKQLKKQKALKESRKSKGEPVDEEPAFSDMEEEDDRVVDDEERDEQKVKEDNNPDEEGEKGKLAGSSSRHENEENVLPADRSSEEITKDKVEGEGVGREDKSTDG